MKSINSVEEYIELYPAEVQLILNKIREIVLTIVLDAVESISYGMPAYKLNKEPLIYFAAFKNHIGLYATPKAHEAFAVQLSNYKQGKGSVQFPLNQEMPYSLIEEILVFKRNQIVEKF